MTKLPAALAVIVGVLASPAAFAAEKTITLAVQHMTCAACPSTVKASLQAVPGVSNVVFHGMARFGSPDTDSSLTAAKPPANPS